MTAKYTGTLHHGGQYQITGRFWRNGAWGTETLVFEVKIDDKIFRSIVGRARSNKSRKSIDGPLTVKYLGMIPTPQEHTPGTITPIPGGFNIEQTVDPLTGEPTKCSEDYCLADGHSPNECSCHCHDVPFKHAQAEALK